MTADTISGVLEAERLRNVLVKLDAAEGKLMGLWFDLSDEEPELSASDAWLLHSFAVRARLIGKSIATTAKEIEGVAVSRGREQSGSHRIHIDPRT